jgi:hypothetical protein
MSQDYQRREPFRPLWASPSQRAARLLILLSAAIVLSLFCTITDRGARQGKGGHEPPMFDPSQASAQVDTAAEKRQDADDRDEMLKHWRR